MSSRAALGLVGQEAYPTEGIFESARFTCESVDHRFLMEVDRYSGIRYMMRALRAGLILIVASFSLYAQVDDYPWDKGELGLTTGAAFGGIGGTQPAFGGVTGVFVNKYGGLLLGSTYMPMGSATVVPHDRRAIQSRLYDSYFALNIQVPLKRRWAPYGLLSPAVLYNTYRLEVPATDGTLAFAGKDDVKFAFEAGGGVRYMAGDSWGVKGEYRYTISTRNFNRVELGVFYRVPANWPFVGRSRTKCIGCSH
jgi:opacity protein-like surface antigen